MTLPDGERTVAGYMILIAQRVQAAEALAVRGLSGEACDIVREITDLAVRAIEDNRERLGLRTVDRAGILSLIPPHAAQMPLSEYLVDIESAVVRYKAHRPGLRGPDAGPKVLNHLLEILSAAAGCK
jgi:hypothetical protein